MKIISQPDQLNAGGRPVCAAIGVFDGVHLGHQAVICQAISDARQQNGVAVVITFDRHPQSIVAPQRAPLLIQPLSRKLAAIEALAADVALVFHFDLEFSRQTAEIFIHSLSQGLGRLQSLSVGANFTFGYQRSGNVAVLKQIGPTLGFAVHDAEPIMFEGQPISSTRIRDAIRNGWLAAVSAMLGRSYAVRGKVMAGDHLGQRLGFPTANLEVTGLILPPNGVYAARARLADQEHPAVLNIGVRPTLQNSTPTPRFEVHLLDWTGDLYGAELEVVFARKLREETQFPSLADLQRQIARDVEQARGVLSN